MDADDSARIPTHRNAATRQRRRRQGRERGSCARCMRQRRVRIRLSAVHWRRCASHTDVRRLRSCATRVRGVGGEQRSRGRLSGNSAADRRCCAARIRRVRVWSVPHSPKHDACALLCRRCRFSPLLCSVLLCCCLSVFLLSLLASRCHWSRRQQTASMRSRVCCPALRLRVPPPPGVTLRRGGKERDRGSRTPGEHTAERTRDNARRRKAHEEGTRRDDAPPLQTAIARIPSPAQHLTITVVSS